MRKIAEADLKKLKSELQSHINESSRLEGKEAALLDRLKVEFAVDTLEDARKVLDDLNGQVDALDYKLQKALEKLEKREVDPNG